MNIKFVDFIKTPTEKTTIGIATIQIDGLGLFRYKVQAGKEGKGMYIKPFSGKANDEYLDAFMFDSRITEGQIDKIIRDGIKPYMQQTQSQSVFNAPAYPQENFAAPTPQYAQVEVQGTLPF